MRWVVSLSALFLHLPAWAGDYRVALDYACLSLDGAPVPKGTVLASKCCVPIPGPECRVGFASMVPDSASDSRNYFDLAKQQIVNAAALNGVELELSDSGSGSDRSEGGKGQPSGAAMLSGGDESSGSGGPTFGGSPLSAESRNGGGGAGGPGQGYGGGVSGEKSLLGRTRGREQNQRGAEDFGGGQYLGGAAAGSKSQGDGKVGSVVIGDSTAIAFGDKAESGEKTGTLNPDGSDSEGMSGTKDDSPDYLNRIDQAASIFKVVSKRYQKELVRNRLRVHEIK
jgi:hypothetical protein